MLGKKRKNFGSRFFVKLDVRIFHRKCAELAREVADVVQEGGHNDLFALALLLGQMCALQHVLSHCYGPAEILLSSSPIEDVSEKRHNGLWREIILFGRVHSAASCRFTEPHSAPIAASVG
jgi:hypothetical protein